MRIAAPALVVALAALPVLERICDLQCASAASVGAAQKPPHCPAHAARGDRPAPPGHPDRCGHSHQTEGALLVSAGGGKIGLAGSATAAALGPSAPPGTVFMVFKAAGGSAHQQGSTPPRLTPSVLRL